MATTTTIPKLKGKHTIPTENNPQTTKDYIVLPTQTMDTLKNKIREELAYGRAPYKIVDNVYNNIYNLNYEARSFSKERCYKYIKEVEKVIKQEWQERNKVLREQQLERVETVYEQAMLRKDYKEANNALKEIDRITGLLEPTKAELSINGNITIDFGFDDASEESDDNEEK